MAERARGRSAAGLLIPVMPVGLPDGRVPAASRTGRPRLSYRSALHESSPVSRARRPWARGYALLMASALLPGTVGWPQAAAAAATPQLPMRDPTLPPTALRPLPPPGAASSADGRTALVAAPPRPTPPTLLVIDGRRYVVDQGRRHGVGDTLVGARIERIDETAVWVRQGGSLRALPMYGSVIKRAPAAAGASEPRGSTAAQRPNDRPVQPQRFQSQLQKTPVTGEPP